MPRFCYVGVDMNRKDPLLDYSCNIEFEYPEDNCLFLTTDKIEETLEFLSQIVYVFVQIHRYLYDRALGIEHFSLCSIYKLVRHRQRAHSCVFFSYIFAGPTFHDYENQNLSVVSLPILGYKVCFFVYRVLLLDKLSYMRELWSYIQQGMLHLGTDVYEILYRVRAFAVLLFLSRFVPPRALASRTYSDLRLFGNPLFAASEAFENG